MKSIFFKVFLELNRKILEIFLNFYLLKNHFYRFRTHFARFLNVRGKMMFFGSIFRPFLK